MKNKTRYLVTAALIAALYAATTYLMALFGLAYGPVQFRISEALCVLPIFCDASVAGLAAGCFIANIISFNPVDMVFGTVATLLSALLTRRFKNVTVRGIPLLSIVQPVIVNGIMIGAELALVMGDRSTAFTQFWAYALWVAAGEAAVCLLLGLPLCLFIKKNSFLLSVLQRT